MYNIQEKLTYGKLANIVETQLQNIKNIFLVKSPLVCDFGKTNLTLCCQFMRYTLVKALQSMDWFSCL